MLSKASPFLEFYLTTVEEFAPGAWFTNPSDNWPAFAERMHSFFPPDENQFSAL
jgi:hypothetical protein